MKPKGWYLEYRLIKGCFIPHDSWLPWKHISMYSRKNINILRNFFREHCLKSNLQQLSSSMFCKNVARFAIARECIHVWQPLATAKQATYLQNILECCSKFNFKKCSLKKILKILILSRKYMKICFHSNQHPWAIKHPFISLYSKYQSLMYICLPVMNSPLFPSLDDIFCIWIGAVVPKTPENA